MIDWFIWNGEYCTDYGMHALTQPTITVPKERVTYTDIPGRGGSLTTLQGSNIYDDLTLSCSCVIDDPFPMEGAETIDLIARIAGWLKGSGTVTFANRDNGFYFARIDNQIPFSKIVRGNPHLSFNVQFRCKPYFYLFDGQDPITFTTSTIVLDNPGNIQSEPLIRIEGSGECTIMFGDEETMLINLGDNDLTYLILDCEAKVAYTGLQGDPLDPYQIRGTRVTGEWFTLGTGRSIFSVTSTSGSITSVTIVPRWRCI